MRIGIIGAMDDEISILRENINDEHINILGVDFYYGKINDNDIILCKSGVGKVNASIATTLMVKEFEVDFIINTGIAGGYKIPKETIVLANSVSYNDVDVSSFGYHIGQIPGMPYEFIPSLDYSLIIKRILNSLKLDFVEAKIYSGDRFVSNPNQVLGLEESKKSAIEMEGAGIAHSCVKLGVDFVILRFISDDILNPNQDDYNAFEKKMADLSANICLRILNELK